MSQPAVSDVEERRRQWALLEKLAIEAKKQQEQDEKKRKELKETNRNRRMSTQLSSSQVSSLLSAPSSSSSTTSRPAPTINVPTADNRRHTMMAPLPRNISEEISAASAEKSKGRIHTESKTKELKEWEERLNEKEKKFTLWEKQLSVRQKEVFRKEKDLESLINSYKNSKKLLDRFILLSPTSRKRLSQEDENENSANGTSNREEKVLQKNQSSSSNSSNSNGNGLVRDDSVEQLRNLVESYQLDAVMKAQKVARRWVFRRRVRKLVQVVEEFQKSNSSKKYRQRIRALKEILVTEKSYVHDLENCFQMFIKPIRAQELLSKEEINNVFSDIELILQLNTQFLTDLQERLGGASDMFLISPNSSTESIHLNLSPRSSFGGSVRGRSSLTNIHNSSGDVYNSAQLFHVGDIFLRMVPMLNLYSRYISNFDASLEALLKCKKKHSRFAEFLKDQKDKKYDLDSYLIMPIQRLPRYQLLLQAVIEYTDSEHVDYPNLVESLTMVKEVITHINSIKRQTEIEEQANRLLIKQRRKSSYLSSSGSLDKKGKPKEGLSKLHIQVLKARNLLAMDDNGKSDPYAILKIGEQECKTKVKKKTLTPEWKEDFVFVMHPNAPHKVTIDVYDWDRGKKDDHIGTVLADYSDLTPGTSSNQWFSLTTLDGKPAGDINIIATLIPYGF